MPPVGETNFVNLLISVVWGKDLNEVYVNKIQNFDYFWRNSRIEIRFLKSYWFIAYVVKPQLVLKLLLWPSTTAMSSIKDDRFFTMEDTFSKLLHRRKELEVIRSELSSSKLSKSPQIFTGFGPGSVFFLSGNPSRLKSDVEKELNDIKKKTMTTTSAPQSSELKF